MAVTIVEDPDRLAGLAAAALLDTPAEDAFDRITRLASRILKCPVSLLSLVDKDRQFFKSQFGLPELFANRRETPLTHSFCQYVVDSGEPLIVEDARLHPTLRSNPAVQDLNVIAYLGIPLTTTSGHVLGSLCAIDSKPRKWSSELIETLTTLTDMVMREIELRSVAQHFQGNWLALTDAEMQRDELVHMLVHDLRNPMSSLLMSLDLMEAPESPAEQAESIAIARRSGHAMLKMINDILDVSKAEAGGLRLDLSEVAAEDLVRFAYEQLNYAAAESSVTLQAEISPGLPAIWADTEKLRRVLVNLIANAIQHSPNGTVTTIVRLGTEGKSLILTVQDTGTGIPPELWERIFDKFGAAAGKRGKVSSGLGLALCKKVAEAHGGTISVTNAPGGGASFSLEISAHLKGGNWDLSPSLY